jgi:excisionase family DNA binding protein
MSRMFCTVKEAAETLNASEDQINTLLERGILHEFRQGPHRLLREADVGALDLRRERGPQIQAPAEPPIPTKPPSPRSSDRPKTSRPAQRKVRRGVTAAAQPPRPPRTKDAGRATVARQSKRPSNAKDRTWGPEPKTQDRGPRPPNAGQNMANGPARPSVVRPPSCAPPTDTLRQWFWMGLVQDRPAAIALLSGLVLLALSALVAGICLAAEGF